MQAFSFNLFKKYRSLIFLGLILVLGLTLRIYQISNAPDGVLVDEASLGYNAYSLLQTGKDEYGKSFPLFFQSFGDAKVPAYIYATILPVALFGLTPFAVKFTAMSAGLILILVIYFLLRELRFNEFESLTGSLITAISPWTIILSRFGWESSFAVTLFTSFLLLFLIGIRQKKSLYFVGGGIVLGISVYTYAPYRLLSVLILTAMTIVFVRQLQKKNILILILSFLLTLLPLLPQMLGQSGLTRLQQASFLSEPQYTQNVIENRNYCQGELPPVACYMLSNKIVEFGFASLNNIAIVLSPQYLFISGEQNLRYVSIEKFGLLPIFLLPLWILGIVVLVKHLLDRKIEKRDIFLLAGLVVTSLPILVTKMPQRIQLSSLYPFMLILLILGLNALPRIQKSLAFRSVLSLICVAFGVLFITFYTSIHVNKYQGDMKHIKDLSLFIHEKSQEGQPVYMKEFISDFLIYYAFYTKIPPAEYQRSIVLDQEDALGFRHSIGVQNISISKEPYSKLACQVNLKNNPIYITNENLSENPEYKTVQPIFVGRTTNGVHALSYVYMLRELIPQNGCTISN